MSILTGLQEGVMDAVKQVLTNFIPEATEDVTAFFASSAGRIERYVKLLVTSQITLGEFKSLILGLRDLAELTALTQAGLAEIEIEKTRNTILKAVTSIAIGAVGKAI